MGFNIAGIAINKNYEGQLDVLKQKFNWKLKQEGTVSFETASGNWKEDGICDIYFLPNATLIFLPMEMCTDPYIIEGSNVLTFVISEMSMAFNIIYTENNKVVRNILEVEGNTLSNEGTPLAVEKEAEDTSEILWKQLEVVLGKTYWDIDLEEKVSRFTFV
ncbi:hypothetical protein [Cytophaga aurantiaca]|uniref:hypothetical protein n=1 Tax=Cytophaga aurantiaca TaxID=29530 RepID=UPI00036660FC|nr:hypothetical protein [Cytophaga aurantiaca]